MKTYEVTTWSNLIETFKVKAKNENEAIKNYAQGVKIKSNIEDIEVESVEEI